MPKLCKNKIQLKKFWPGKIPDVLLIHTFVALSIKIIYGFRENSFRNTSLL